MNLIIPPSDNLKYVIGQKIKFYVESIENTDSIWTLNALDIIKENNISVIEEEGLISLNNILYNYCTVKLKSVGDFFIKFTNSNNESDSISKFIYGLDPRIISKQTNIWSNDVGTLCKGLSGNIQRINKWSVFKPIRDSSKTITESDPWVNKDRFLQNGAGMKINLWDGMISNVSFLDFLNNSLTDNSWDYLYPRGSSFNEYFRLNDFLGYTNESNKSVILSKNLDCLYKLNTSNVISKDNWDTYILEDKNDESIISFSDILIDGKGVDEFNLAVLVIDNNSNRYFIKVFDELSNNFELIVPIEDLFKSSELLKEDYFFGIKENITRHYFLCAQPLVTNEWIELTSLYRDEIFIKFPPNSFPRRYNQILEIFRYALPIPLTSFNRNYKIENKIIISTSSRLNVYNNYNTYINLPIEIYQNNIIKHKYNSIISNNQPSIFTFNDVLPEGKIKFKNCLESSVFKIDIGLTGTYNKIYRPDANKEINIIFSDLFDSISELNWNTTENKLEISQENIYLNFINSEESDQSIFIEFDNSQKLNLDINTSSKLLKENNNFYEFRNLTNYNIKIYPNDINIVNQINISSQNDSRIQIINNIIIDDYILLSLFINLGNGEYNDLNNPINIEIIIK